MNINDLFFIIALICSCVCSYLFGGIVGYRKGKLAGFHGAIQSCTETAMDIFKKLNIDSKILAEAARQNIVDDLKKSGFDQKQSETLADRFLQS